ncbi:39812_t:CDS:2, partial [Gigaspora margarita]
DFEHNLHKVLINISEKALSNLNVGALGSITLMCLAIGGL